VSGVTVLISLIEKTGGIDLISSIPASASSWRTVIAFIAGSISIYCSTAIVAAIRRSIVFGLLWG